MVEQFAFHRHDKLLIILDSIFHPRPKDGEISIHAKSVLPGTPHAPTDSSHQIPCPTLLANKGTTAISLARVDLALVVSSAPHSIGYGVTMMLCVGVCTVSTIDEGDLGLVQSFGKRSSFVQLTPPSHKALSTGAEIQTRGRQADGFDTLGVSDRVAKFDQRDVVVKVARVVLLMCDYFINLHLLFMTLGRTDFEIA